jgi:hypothetical protein
MMFGWSNEVEWRMSGDALFPNEHSDGAFGVIDGPSVYIRAVCAAYTVPCGDLLSQIELLFRRSLHPCSSEFGSYPLGSAAGRCISLHLTYI